MGRSIVFVPDANSFGKADASGAFWPEAEAFLAFRREKKALALHRFPATGPMIRREAFCSRTLAALEGPPIDTLAFFCHGWHSGLQAGYRIRTVHVLAQLLLEKATPDAHVLLYACDAGGADADALDPMNKGPGGDGGFADELRDACEKVGQRVTVVGHSTTGHCVWNPHVRRFSPGYGGKGGTFYVEPFAPHWRPWVRALRDPTSNLRWRFPYMTNEAIAAELAGPSSPLVG